MKFQGSILFLKPIRPIGMFANMNYQAEMQDIEFKMTIINSTEEVMGFEEDTKKTVQ